MTHHLHLPHLNIRVFTVLVFVSFPLMAVAAAMVLGVGQGQLRDAYGLQITQIAEHTAAAVDTYVFRRVIDVATLTRVPEVRAAATAGSAVPVDQAKLKDLEQAWQHDRSAEAQRIGLVDNAASKFLRELVDNDKIYREIVVTDRQGRLVAASNVPASYYVGDAGWWALRPANW